MIMAIALTALCGTAAAQETTRELTKAERKALQQQIDSLQHVEAAEAVADSMFTLEADHVVFKYGQRAYVTSTTNFVAVKKDRATVQVAFNVPVAGPNGMGGVTVDGVVSDYHMSTDRHGNLTTTMNVLGAGISARLTILLFADTNEAKVEISPNFNSQRLTLEGHILPSSRSFVVKGNSI